jgi:predicted nucleotidyltransferase
MPYRMTESSKRSRKLEEELNRALQAIQSLNPQKVILFGSAARENIHSKSDLDLLVIWDTPQSFLERSQTMYDVIEPNIGMDILVYTPEEIEKFGNSNPFIHQALTEGRVVYERQL